MLQLNCEEKFGPQHRSSRSAKAIAHEQQNIAAVRRAVQYGHKTKCGMICNAIKSGLTDAEVIDHLRIQKRETTIGSVRALRHDLRKIDPMVMTNAQVIALRGAF